MAANPDEPLRILVCAIATAKRLARSGALRLECCDCGIEIVMSKRDTEVTDKTEMLCIRCAYDRSPEMPEILDKLLEMRWVN